MKLFISFTRQIRRNKSPFFLIFSFRKKRRDTFVEIPPILTEGARINRGEGKKKKIGLSGRARVLARTGRTRLTVRMKTRDWNRRFAVAGRLTMKSSHRKRTNCRHNNYSTVPGPAATSSSARGLRIDRGLCY